MKNLTIIWHSRTGATEQAVQIMQEAIYQLLASEQIEGQLTVRSAELAKEQDLISADGLIFACPENLAAMSGVMKEFFDRNYYAVLDKLNGKGYGLLVCAGSDGHNAVRQIQRIANGWRLRQLGEALIVCTQAQSQSQILALKALSQTQRDAIREFAQNIAGQIFLL